MSLPVLRKINLNRPKKRKILLLCDDIRFPSGIATMAREFVVGTADEFDWIQLGAGIDHPDHGKIFDVSNDANEALKIDHANIKIYAHNGYGNPQVLRELLEKEKPSAILIFTDPRFWGWLFQMEHELRQRVPIMYLNIWDCPPAPHWNFAGYASCDLIMNISKQTHNLVEMVLDYGGVEIDNIDKKLL